MHHIKYKMLQFDLGLEMSFFRFIFLLQVINTVFTIFHHRVVGLIRRVRHNVVVNKFNIY